MLSNQQFQQQLQAGDIKAALALVMQAASELDIVTETIEDSQIGTESEYRKYLRTKINLLTGTVHNEVSKDLSIDRDSYQQLQKLHSDRIIASHQQIQSYLERIKAILTVVASLDTEGLDRLKSTSVVALLARSIERAPLSHQHEDRTISNPISMPPNSEQTSDSTDRELQPSAPPIDISLQPESLLMRPQAIDNSDMPLTLESMPTSNVAPLENLPIDDDLDIYLALDDEVWEEWVEDEDMTSSSTTSLPPQNVSASPSWQDRFVRRHLNPVDVKPIVPRTAAGSLDSLAPWDRFEPEYIGISTEDWQHSPATDRDLQQMNQLLTDLDI